MGKCSEFQAAILSGLTSTEWTVTSGHLRAKTLAVGPPTYPAPMQQIRLIGRQNSGAREAEEEEAVEEEAVEEEEDDGGGIAAAVGVVVVGGGGVASSVVVVVVAADDAIFVFRLVM